VIGAVWGLLLVGAILASSVMAILWVVQARIHDASHVDVAWAVLIACAAILYALLADGDSAYRVLGAVLASVWGFRLGAYLYVNRVRGKGEDGRYRALRAKWGARANRNFFWFFQFQAVFVVFFSIPFALIALEDESGFDALVWIGIAVWAIGKVGTIVSDRQLAIWRADPSTKGRTASRLWSWSRHPELLRVRQLVRNRARRDGDAVGLDRVDRARGAALPPVPGDGHPGDGGASAPESCRLRRVPAHDERLRPAPAAACVTLRACSGVVRT
jgi:hypothetical protein